MQKPCNLIARSALSIGVRGLGANIPAQKLQADLIAARNALRESDARFNTLADALPHMVWSTLPDGDHDYFNARWYEFTGVAPGRTDGAEWESAFHPADREQAWQRWRKSLETGKPYEVEYRLRHRSGEYRWVLGRAMPVHDSDGKIVRWIGTCTDIHDAKRHREQIEVLSRELSHRIKNIFAVIGSLISLSARQAPDHKPFATKIRQRIAALARAHEFVRPHSDQSRQVERAVTLHALIEEILSPYPAYEAGKIVISGEDVSVDDRSATPLALLIHELATNATKYGALSNDAGRVDLTTQVENEELVLRWDESGGPRIAGQPQTSGFGTVLSELSIEGQLGGRLSRNWAVEGLKVTAQVPCANLRRQATAAEALTE